MRTLFLVCWLIGFVVSGPAAEPFQFKDGDKVVFLGDTWMEREQQEGYIEARLTSRLQGKRVIFRNLAWSADTVLGESRAGFDPPEKGFDRLKEQLQAVKPTVAFLAYGMAESFQGEAGLAKFRADMNRLMDTIQEVSKPEPVRFIICTPLYHENLGAPLPDPAAHNEQLRLYARALREIATERKALLVDLFATIEKFHGSGRAPKLTDNGIHPTPLGFWRLAPLIESALGYPPEVWRVGFLGDSSLRPGSGGLLTSDVKKSAGGISFAGQEQVVVYEPAPRTPGMTNFAPAPLLQVADLPSGKYTLKIDGQVAAVHDAEAWGKSVRIEHGPAFDQARNLRETIVKKNELFFHRWRPQNHTYLFGFRKYEQGQNAKEIPMFDPLIAEQEEKIFTLNQLKKRRYELVPAQAGDEDLLAAKAPAQPDPAREVFDATPLPQPVFQLAPDLEVTLFAENPDLAKPIHMNFDPEGRLWVASSEVYPQIQPGQKATDKILILEDTNNDGKSDKTTIFADGLLIPTGVEPGDGGAYVANSTELLFYKDLDGDGRADHKQVLLSGFGTEDTHHILHTLRWGHDGQLYMNQSIYIHSHVETPHGVVRLDSGGIWNFRPPTRELGIHLKGLINSWGHHFDKLGQSFATDGAGHEGINWVVPQAMYVTYEGARRILGSVSPGNYPKFCGLEVIESPHFPEDWQGSMVTCDFRAHRVVRFSINDSGAGYITKELPDLMRTTNVTFRPIDVKVGPDGAIFIADWSNPIIQHGEVDFRDPRRDREHGRIWRVTHKKGKTVQPVNLLAASNSELLDHLNSANGYLRQRARRVLTERGAAVLPDLQAWAKKQTSDSSLLEALWMHQSLDVPDADLLRKLLKAEDGRIRAAATRVLSFWRDRLENPLDLLTPLAADEHQRVRLEAVRAAAKIPEARATELVLSVVEKPMDKYLDYAVWLSINDLAEPWVAAVQKGEWDIKGREKQLDFALRAVEPRYASTVLTKVLADNPIPADGSGPWIELIARAGSAEHLTDLYAKALGGGFAEAAQIKAFNALAEAARLRQAVPQKDRAKLVSFFNGANPQLASAAIRLAGQWKLREAVNDLVSRAGASETAQELRTAAFQSLREIGGGEAVAGLERLAAKGAEETGSASVRVEAVKALASLDLGKGVQAAVAVLPELKDEESALGFWRSMLANKGAAQAFAQSLPKEGLPLPVVKAGLRAAREGGRNEPNLVLALARNAEEGESRNLSPEEIAGLLQYIREKGDPARGELVYRRQELGCVSCHAIGGVGGKVGPDMTSIGASAPLDYLVESLQFPNRKVKEGYHSLMVETSDEMELSGILVRETDEQLILRDASNREVPVPKKDIVKRSTGGSIMPAGLIDHLSEQDQADLYRFLSELGKPGPYDASKGNVARVWRLNPRTLDLAQFEDEKIVNMDQSNWEQAMTLVDGRLPRSEMEAALKRIHYRNPDAIYASARFEVSRTGPVTIELPKLSKAAAWIDGKLVPLGQTLQANLSSGPHILTIKVEASSLPDYLRAATSDATFLNQ